MICHGIHVHEPYAVLRIWGLIAKHLIVASIIERLCVIIPSLFASVCKTLDDCKYLYA